MKLTKSPIAWLLLALLVSTNAWAAVTDIQHDLRNIQRYRLGQQQTFSYLANHRLFGEQAPQLPSASDKQELRNAWSRYLDYVLATDSIIKKYKAKVAEDEDLNQPNQFIVFYAAYISQYRNALDMLAVLDKNKDVHVILNEPIPTLGLRENGFSDFKYRFLHVKRAAEFLALEPTVLRFENLDESVPFINGDRLAVIKYGVGKGSQLTLKNGLKIVADSVNQSVFPVQAGVAEWAGDTKVYRQKTALISEDNIKALQKQLRPGDVLLERREWYLSNIGLPGYWPHAALYIGTPKERETFFNDITVQHWVRSQGAGSGNFNDLLAARLPGQYKLSQVPENGHDIRVIEAISEGVSFTSLEHSAAADAVAALRPKLNKLQIAKAIFNAISHARKPYDFNFDFRTDNALVCTELVFKAFEASIAFEISSVAGRDVVTANDIAKQHSTSDDSPWQFVAFLDGNEKTHDAVWRDEAEFKQSWLRPKWHIVTRSALETED